MKLSELAREVLGAKVKGGDAEIRGLCIDSRVAGKGDLFFCFRGTHTDSHVFAGEAERRGASAVGAERELEVNLPQLLVPDGREAMSRVSAAFYGHPEKKLSFVGVTGTNGKTTVSQMLRNIFGEEGKRAGVIGTLGASYASVEVSPSLTTPDPVFLFSLLADMVQANTEIAVMEVSAHALALKKELPICYDIAVFTN
ncbi:MAG: UDP-N-acetylmuramoyl-L-alanyl-D-glutamate--2,6-diaminopimelate ligase, partial [Clostridia bacterium]|nr:UDP-N-acetylmuramoyl-L-alanyl-D-glutamate--2,6-diaminopimelate ligase [Clostridia bacterium]